jgi:hypothetical protein
MERIQKHDPMASIGVFECIKITKEDAPNWNHENLYAVRAPLRTLFCL